MHIDRERHERARRAGALYFAYDSNLDPDQMWRRCPGARPAGTAVLRGHRLSFAGWSSRWGGGGVATVTTDRCGQVDGRLWILSASDLETLDRCEGVAAGAYSRRQRVVVLADGSRRRAHVYLQGGDWTRPPSWDYLGKILRAYHELGFDHAPLLDAARRAREQQVMTTRVFTYGTLMRGELNHALLGSSPFVRTARTEPWFELVSLGSFPAMVRGGEASVVGEVYEVDCGTLAELDALEGHPDFYRRERVGLEGGEEMDAYLLEPEQAASAPRIACGDWTAWRRSMSEPVQTEMWP